MAKVVNGDRGLFCPISGSSTFTATGSRVFAFRDAGKSADILGAMESGDRGDFIRAAIAEKLERDSSNQENCLREG